MADQIVTYGYGTQDLIITGGYFSSGNDLFNRVLSALEKKNVAVNWIEPEYIEDGLADETILDSIVASAEKKSVTVSWIDPRFIKAGLADHTLMDAIIGRIEG